MHGQQKVVINSFKLKWYNFWHSPGYCPNRCYGNETSTNQFRLQARDYVKMCDWREQVGNFIYKYSDSMVLTLMR